MSLGNTNDQNNRGNNYSWQVAMLKQLQGINKSDLVAIGYQQLTVSGGVAQSLTVPAGTTYCEIRVESATTTGILMYYTLLGASLLPTASTGMPLTYLDLFDINGAINVNNFRVIAVSGSHKLDVQYYK